MIITRGERVGVSLAGWVLPSDLHAVGLGQGNREEEGHPENGTLLLNLLEVTNCWACKFHPQLFLFR
jgi:hypothetical protein